MKTKFLPWLLVMSVCCHVTAQTLTLDALPNQFTETETNALVFIQRNPGTPQRKTGAIPLWKLPIVGSGGSSNAITGLSGAVTATGPGLASATLANGVVGSNNIQAGAINIGHILNGSVDASKIADGAVGDTQIATAAVTTQKLRDANVTVDKIATGAVTDPKIEHSTAGITSSASVLTVDLSGAQRQTNSESGPLTLAISNKPSTSVNRWRVLQLYPTGGTLTLTTPSTLGGSPVRWITKARSTITQTNYAEIFIGWNGNEVLLADANAPSAITDISPFSSADFAGVITDETGTDKLVYNTSPLLITPSINGAIGFQMGTRQSFNPSSTTAGVNLGTLSADPSSGLEGDVYVNSSTHKGRVYLNGAWGDIGTGTNGAPIFVQRSQVTVANTGTETSLLGTLTGSATLSTNYLTQGRNIHFEATGRISTDASAPGTGNLKIKLGSTVIMTTGALTLPSNITNDLWRIVADITCWTEGASGTVFGQGFLFINDKVSKVPIVYQMVNTTTSTIDTTATQAFGVTFQWGTADSDNTLTCSMAFLADGPGGGSGSGGGSGGSGGSSSFNVNSVLVTSPNLKDNQHFKHPVSGSDITIEPQDGATLSYSGTNVTADASANLKWELTLSQNTGLAISGGSKWNVLKVYLKQNGTGGFAVTLNTNNMVFTSTIPYPVSFSTGANMEDVLVFEKRTSTLWTLTGVSHGAYYP